MGKNYDKALTVMTSEINWGNIRVQAKKILFYYIACAGFSLNVSIPLVVLFFLKFKKDFTALNILISLIFASGFSVVAFFIFISAPMKEMTEFLRKINFFRVYLFYLPKGFLRCVRKTLCALIRSARFILLSL